MQPRFQIFVSSTFRDLREERQAALEAILELGHFPAGMETFPAADATPWDLIRSIISESDYYVLIIGGKYGSTGPDGISYTQMEFNLALELNKPILPFLHGAPDLIPAGKSELDPEARQRLEAFRSLVAERHCKSWTNKENLKAAVLLAIVHAIRTKPAFGWVRNEGLENQELLKRLASLQERYDALHAEAEVLRSSNSEQTETSRFAGLNSIQNVRFKVGTDKSIRTARIPLSTLFFGIADNMLVPCVEYRIHDSLKPVVVDELAPSEIGDLARYADDKADYLRRHIELQTESVEDILRQLLAIGLCEPQLVLRQTGDEKRTSTISQRCWVLTKHGRTRYLEKRARLASDD